MTGLRSAVAALLVLWGLSAFAQAPAAAPAAPRFDINAFAIEGNTLFQLYELHAVVEPYTGKQKDFGDIQRALEALQAFYIARGYNAVRVLVPEQDIRAGSVRLQVIEARIRQVRVQGSYWDRIALRWRIAEPLAPGREDIAWFEHQAARYEAEAKRALLLGVTARIATMRWPAGTSLVAADWSSNMLTMPPGFSARRNSALSVAASASEPSAV